MSESITLDALHNLIQGIAIDVQSLKASKPGRKPQSLLDANESKIVVTDEQVKAFGASIPETLTVTTKGSKGKDEVITIKIDSDNAKLSYAFAVHQKMLELVNACNNVTTVRAGNVAYWKTELSLSKEKLTELQGARATIVQKQLDAEDIESLQKAKVDVKTHDAEISAQSARIAELEATIATGTVKIGRAHV